MNGKTKKCFNMYRFFIFVLLIIAVLTLILGYHKKSRFSDTIIQLEYGDSIPDDTYGQLFWIEENESFQEKHSKKFRLNSDQVYYAVNLPALSFLRSIRFDPINSNQKVLIKSIKIKEKNSVVQEFDSPGLLVDLLQPINRSVEMTPVASGVFLQPLSGDPRLQINVDYLEKRPMLTWSLICMFIWGIGAVVAGVLLLRQLLQYWLSFQDRREGVQRLLLIIEIACSCIIIMAAVFYLGEWLGKMSSSSLWTDEIYTIENFSSKGITTSLTDYHAANNHILFNALNSLLPNADSYEPVRARLISFVAILSCVGITLWFYFKRQWFVAGALVIVALTSSWSHLVLMLEARGYGLAVFSGLLLVYSVYSYLSKGGAIALCGAVCGAVIGTMSIPTFGFFGLPLLGLLVIIKRDRKTILAVLLGYGLVAALYVPLLPDIMKINAGYSDRWGAEYKSFTAIIDTLQNYLLPGTGKEIAIIVLICIVIVALFPWRKYPGTVRFAIWRPVAISILLFFSVCVFLKTPAARTTAFITLPVAAMLVSVFSFHLKNVWLRGGWVVILTVVSVFVFRNYSEKRAILEVYYQPNENWKGSAELIQHIFPPGNITIYNNFRSRFLKKYLSNDYEVVEDFSAHNYLTGTQVVVDSRPWEKGWVESNEDFKDGDLFRVPQVRADFQTILYRIPSAAKDFTITSPGRMECSTIAGDTSVEDLNRCRDYINNQIVEIAFGKPQKLYSFNISGKGLSANKISTIMGRFEDEWVDLSLDSKKVFYEEGRRWKRDMRYPKGVLSFSLRSDKIFDRLRISIRPLSPGEPVSISSIWYQ